MLSPPACRCCRRDAVCCRLALDCRRRRATTIATAEAGRTKRRHLRGEVVELLLLFRVRLEHVVDLLAVGVGHLRSAAKAALLALLHDADFARRRAARSRPRRRPAARRRRHCRRRYHHRSAALTTAATAIAPPPKPPRLPCRRCSPAPSARW